MDWTTPEGIAELERLRALNAWASDDGAEAPWDRWARTMDEATPALIAEIRRLRDENTRLRAVGEADTETMCGLFDDIGQARDQLAESQALLALWSGGRAGRVPEGFTCDADGDPLLLRRAGRLTVELRGDGRWVVWRDLDDPDNATVIDDHPGPRPIPTACAEALAWLAEREVKRG